VGENKNGNGVVLKATREGRVGFDGTGEAQQRSAVVEKTGPGQIIGKRHTAEPFRREGEPRPTLG